MQRVKRGSPEKLSGVPLVKSAILIDLKPHVKIALTKGQLAKYA